MEVNLKRTVSKMASLMEQFEQQYSVQTAEITAKIGKLVRDVDTPSCDSGENENDE